MKKKKIKEVKIHPIYRIPLTSYVILKKNKKIKYICINLLK